MARKRKKYGLCPKCKKEKNLTKHHILPKRHFGNNDHIVLICRDCHDDIEKLIPFHRIRIKDYFAILQDFLGLGG